MQEKPIKLGNSGLTVGPLGLGTWSWGNKVVCSLASDANSFLVIVHSRLI